MRLGVSCDQYELGSDPGAIREYARAAEDTGYDYLTVSDNVLGADPAYYPDRAFHFTYRDIFNEPLVLLGYLAGVTEKIELVTRILILPQRQTALVAKQAAEVDFLSEGRLRVGIGLGCNSAEFEALGHDFGTRGRRSEEQIALLRALWTKEIVNFEGRWDRIIGMGLNPLPVQRPIPIWMGGSAVPALRRIARLADGWLSDFRPPEQCREPLHRMRKYALEVGRDPKSIGVEGRIDLMSTPPDAWVSTVVAWQELGATHVFVDTEGAGLTSLEQQIDAIHRFYKSVNG
jgi:probable F420-dependent oxidoreductase